MELQSGAGVPGIGLQSDLANCGVLSLHKSKDVSSTGNGVLGRVLNDCRFATEKRVDLYWRSYTHYP